MARTKLNKSNLARLKAKFSATAEVYRRDGNLVRAEVWDEAAAACDELTVRNKAHAKYSKGRSPEEMAAVRARRGQNT